jgi:phage tail sheath gpL-like
MSISFNEISNQGMIPFTYLEFDESRATSQGDQEQYKVLFIGHKNGGSKPPNAPMLVESRENSDTYFGRNSMLSQMIEASIKNSSAIEAYALAVDEPAGNAAQWNIAFDQSVNAKQGPVIALSIGGSKVQFPCGDTVSDTLRNAVMTINNSGLPVTGSVASPTVSSPPRAAPLPAPSTASSDATVMTLSDTSTPQSSLLLTFNHNGFIGQTLSVISLEMPDGVTCKITVVPKTGNGEIDVAKLFASLDDTQYHLIAFPFSSPSNLKDLREELDARSAPDRQNEGLAFVVVQGSDVATVKAGIDSVGSTSNISPLAMDESLTPPWVWVSALASVVGHYGNIDPARPFTTLPILGVLPPRNKRFRNKERNQILAAGGSTYVVSDGICKIERLMTTHKVKQRPMSVNVRLTLSFIRYSFNAYFSSRYPRYKLATDNAKFGPGQCIMTPKLAKVEAINWFRSLEEEGLVQDVELFKSNLIVEINESVPERLDFYLTPKLVEEFLITGAKVAYIR